LPNLPVAPMLAENVSRVKHTIHVKHHKHLGHDGFMDTMKGKSIVAFVELGLRSSRTIQHRIIVSKDKPPLTNPDAKIMEGSVKID
jgi:hypothetical protein